MIIYYSTVHDNLPNDCFTLPFFGLTWHMLVIVLEFAVDIGDIIQNQTPVCDVH